MNRGTLKHRTLPAGSRAPDWEGYVVVDGERWQLIGWTRPDGSIGLVQQGREWVAKACGVSDERQRPVRERDLSALEMYRHGPKYGKD